MTRAILGVGTIVVWQGVFLLVATGFVAAGHSVATEGDLEQQHVAVAGPRGESKKMLTREEVMSVYEAAIAKLEIGEREQSGAIMNTLAAPEALPTLAILLRDENECGSTRGTAASVLGTLGTRAARDVITEVLSQTVAVNSSFEPGSELYFALTGALAQCMAKESEEQLLKDLRDENFHVRESATRLLAERKYRAAVGELIRLRDDPDYGVRAAATQALREIRDSLGLDELAEVRGGGWSQGGSASRAGSKDLAVPDRQGSHGSVGPGDISAWRYGLVGDTPEEAVAAVKRRLEDFGLILQWIPDEGEEAPRYPSLVLMVRKPGSVRLRATVGAVPARWRMTQISEDEARRVVDHLWDEGFFHRADSAVGSLPRSTGCYYLEVVGAWRGGERPPWNLEFTSRLERLRDVLDDGGGGARLMDALLE